MPPPESFGAPRPRMRSSLPSSEPAGTFSETAPSGVGTWTVVPSAASGNDTGTVDEQVVAAPLVRVRGLDVRDDEEVAGGRAAVARPRLCP